MEHYPGEPEPRCHHDPKQPAWMCTECSKLPEVIQWHKDNDEASARRLAGMKAWWKV